MSQANEALAADTEVERSDLRSILEGQAIQYPNQESSRIKGIGEINKILPGSVSTQAAPDLQAMNLPEQPTLPSVNSSLPIPRYTLANPVRSVVSLYPFGTTFPPSASIPPMGSPFLPTVMLLVAAVPA